MNDKSESFDALSFGPVVDLLTICCEEDILRAVAVKLNTPLRLLLLQRLLLATKEISSRWVIDSMRIEDRGGWWHCCLPRNPEATFG